jgi:cell division protein FtsB
MSKTKIAITILIVFVLLVSLVGVTFFYFKGELDNKNSEIVSLNEQIANLKNETSNLRNETENLNNEISELNSEISNLTSYRAQIINFSSDGRPNYQSLGQSYYNFGIGVRNVGCVIIQNITLTAIMSLNNGETSYTQSKEINSLGIGVTHQVTGSVFIKGFVGSLYGLGQTWSFKLTTPEGILAEQTFQASG